jgi:hypothetical protein
MSDSRSRPKNWLHVAEALQVEGVVSSELKKWYVDFPAGKNKVQGMCQRYKIEYCLSEDEKKKRGLNVGAGVKNLSTEDENTLRVAIQTDFFDQGKQLENNDLIRIVHNHVNSIENHPMRDYYWSKNWCRRFLRRHNVESRSAFSSPPNRRDFSWELELNPYGKQKAAELGLKFDGTTPPLHINWLLCQKMLEKDKLNKKVVENKSACVRVKRSITSTQILVSSNHLWGFEDRDSSDISEIPVKRKTSPVNLELTQHQQEPKLFTPLSLFPEKYASLDYLNNTENDEIPMTALFRVVSFELCKLNGEE